MVSVVLLTQIPAAAYLSLWHQSGTIAVMSKLNAAADNGEIHGGGIHFLTPCHQTPFYSHVHRREIRMRVLACPPTPPGEKDESERFLEHPGRFLTEMYGRGWADETTGSLMSARAWAAALGRREVETARATAGYVPSHVVMFNGTFAAPGMADWLASWGFTRRWDLFHAHFEVDRELQARVWVFAREPPGDFDAAAAEGRVEEAAAIAEAALREAEARRGTREDDEEDDGKLDGGGRVNGGAESWGGRFDVSGEFEEVDNADDDDATTGYVSAVHDDEL